MKLSAVRNYHTSVVLLFLDKILVKAMAVSKAIAEPIGNCFLAKCNCIIYSFGSSLNIFNLLPMVPNSQSHQIFTWCRLSKDLYC